MSIFFRMRGVERAPASGGEIFSMWMGLRVVVHREYQPDHVHTVSSSVENRQVVITFKCQKRRLPRFFIFKCQKKSLPRFCL